MKIIIKSDNLMESTPFLQNNVKLININVIYIQTQ